MNIQLAVQLREPLNKKSNYTVVFRVGQSHLFPTETEN